MMHGTMNVKKKITVCLLLSIVPEIQALRTAAIHYLQSISVNIIQFKTMYNIYFDVLSTVT